MIAFEIHLNGEKLCVAGIDASGVLSQSLAWVGREPSADAELQTIEPHLHIGGLSHDEYVSWIRQRTLAVGIGTELQRLKSA